MGYRQNRQKSICIGLCIALLTLSGCSRPLPVELKNSFLQEETISESESVWTASEEEAGSEASATYESGQESEAAPAELSEELLQLLADGYYYSLLSEEEQTVYGEIYQIVTDMADFTQISTKDEDLVTRVFNAMQYDHPEIFWLSGHRIVKALQNDEILYINFKGEYTCSIEERDAYRAQLESAIEEALGTMPVGADYETVKAVYEYVVRETTYSTEAAQNQNVLSVFLNHESVCTGYAKSVQLLMQRLGIPCIYVTGSSKDERHAWNAVYLDGDWYELDATWGDVGPLDGELDAEALEALAIRYDYLNLTTEQMRRDHEADTEFELPECVAMQDNYFYREGKYLTSFDTEQLKAIFDAGGANVHFMCSDETVYNEYYQYLITDNAVFDYYAEIPTDENGRKHARFTCNQTLFTFVFW